jgi:hypothetical protein
MGASTAETAEERKQHPDRSRQAEHQDAEHFAIEGADFGRD